MNLSCTGILDFDRHAVILPLRQHLQRTLLESRLAQTKINKTNLYFLQQKEAQNFFRPSHGVSQVRMQGSPLDYLLGYPLHQASRKLLCLVWNGGRGGRNSNCATALQVLLDIKDPWNMGRAECNTSYVPFWPLFSHTTHSSPLFLSSGRPPVPSPSPVSPGFKKIFESWPFPPPPFLLPSLPYHCSPLQLLSPELPHLVLHPGIFIQLLKPPAPPLPQPLCWLFALFFSFTVPLQRQGSSVRAGGSLPALGPGVTVASQTRNCRNIPRAQPGQVPLGSAVLSHVLPQAGRSSDRHSLQGEYLQNAVTNWMYKKAQHFEDARLEYISLGIPKGVHFKSSLQSMEALQVIKKKNSWKNLL